MADEESRRLHARVLIGAPEVSAELWVRFHPQLVTSMKSAFPVLDEEDIHDIVTDVILSYVERPQQYNPEQRSLGGYLRMAAKGDLLNLLQRRTRLPRLLSLDPVAHDQPDRNRAQEAAEQEARLQAYLPAGVNWERFMRKVSDLVSDPGERKVIELIAEGERDTARFAAALGCGHLSLAEQRRRVKQAKDRLRVRLKRQGMRLHE